MERAGIELTPCAIEIVNINDVDPVAFIIGRNIHRRHLDPQQQLNLIVDARMAVSKPGHDGPVSKGGRGKVNPVKAAVMADAKAAGLNPSERTVKRFIAKAAGKVPAKPKRRSKAEIDEARAKGVDAVCELATMPKYTARPMPKPKSGKPVVGIDAARRHYLDLCADPGVDLEAEQEIIVDALRAIDSKRALNGGKSQSPASALPHDGRSEDGSL